MSEAVLKLYSFVCGTFTVGVIESVSNVVDHQLLEAYDCRLARRFVPFNELCLVCGLLVQGPLIEPAQRIFLMIRLRAVSDWG